MLGKYGREVLSVINKNNADEFALDMQPIIDDLQDRGIDTVRAIASELNKRQIPTYRNCGCWHTNTVYRLITRLSCSQNQKNEKLH